jgi:hypothetical protein
MRPIPSRLYGRPKSFWGRLMLGTGDSVRHCYVKALYGLLYCSAVAAQAAAPASTGEQLQEVIATAQRRQERLQDFPTHRRCVLCGMFGQSAVEAAASGPLSNTLSVRAAGVGDGQRLGPRISAPDAISPRKTARPDGSSSCIQPAKRAMPEERQPPRSVCRSSALSLVGRPSWFADRMKT